MKILLIVLLLWSLPALGKPLLKGLATTYDKEDPLSGKSLGCESAAVILLGSKRFIDHLPLIATRGKTTPIRCGQVVRVTVDRTRKSTLAIKLDTGPFSAYKEGQPWKIATRLQPGWKRKSNLDMTPPVALATQHNGLEPVTVTQPNPNEERDFLLWLIRAARTPANTMLVGVSLGGQ